MGKTRASLRGLLDSPYRRLIVITVTFVTGLVTILPLADEYAELTKREGELESDLSQAHTVAANLTAFEFRLRQSERQLREIEDRTVSGDHMSAFRDEIVSVVRESGCHLRRINAGSIRSRQWYKTDNPLEKSTRRKKSDATGFRLENQPFTLSVRGTASEVRNLLQKLHARRDIAHTNGLSLRPAGQDRQEIDLDIELWLFDLSRENTISA